MLDSPLKRAGVPVPRGLALGTVAALSGYQAGLAGADRLPSVGAMTRPASAH
jgi:hypothetical protein